GVALLIWGGRRSAESGSRTVSTLEDMAYRQACIIGLAQCLAFWPGVSRSLATITGAILAGLSLGAAVEFSFLLGFLTLAAAAVYELTTTGSALIETYGITRPLTGLLMALIFAALSMRWMIQYLQNHSLRVFGWYRILLALVIGLAVGFGWI
ncbi:MAG: undecaprenyl-diphosphate phosphatase, partial [Kiritimatiellia bacterium]|nr:undecaprenyl-diphosphate phosphatase [Kiritimatiellia bacterium]